MTATSIQTYPVGLGDVIEFQPRYGKPRIIEVTAVHGHGFDGQLIGNRTVKTFGFYAQITRVLRRNGEAEAVVHKTKTTSKGNGLVAWECTCEYSEIGVGETDDEAMHEARVQQREHLNTVRDVL